MTYTIWLIKSPYDVDWHTRCFLEVAHALQFAFAQLGHVVPLVYDPAQARGTVITLGGRLLHEIPGPLPEGMVIYNFEQVHENGRFFKPGHPYIDFLKRYPVWDYSHNNIAALKKLGVSDITYCGVGYVQTLTRTEPPREQDIDVLFIGTRHPRRQRIMDELAAQGVRTHFIHNMYGEERDAFIFRSKLILNIHLEPAGVFEVVRASYLLANRKCVISETGKDAQLEEPFGRAVVFAPYEKLVETCLEYVRDDAKRAAQEERALAEFSRMDQAPMLISALQDFHKRHPIVQERAPRIFVNIASYRDTECQHTVKDLFDKALKPERVNVGICWQYEPDEDADCFIVAPPRPEQVRAVQYHTRDSQGACWARSQAQALWQGEEYVLQIDSHMRFEPGWDETLIELLQRCPTQKSVLTAWLPGYLPPDQKPPLNGQMPLSVVSRLGEREDPQPVHLIKRMVPAQSLYGRLLPTCSWVGNFLFAPASALQEVPFDPYFSFWGEEINFSTRLWTHGYDIFHLDRIVLYHYWDRTNVKKSNNNYRDRADTRSRFALQRNLHLLGLRPADDSEAIKDLQKYSLGTARALQDYWRFTGIDLARHTLAPRAQRGEWTLLSANAVRPAAIAGQPRIFVNIASYRDPECQHTVKDLFEKAQKPDRIFVGICLQIFPSGDEVCMVPSDRPQQLRIIRLDARASGGANWARAQAQSLWQGEEYVLQIDSHMRFEPGWDEAMIEMLEACPSEKSVLSTYVPRYTPPNTLYRTPEKLLRICVQSMGKKDHPQLLHLSRTQVPRKDKERSGLYRSPFYIANFMFCRSALTQEVPFDPHIRFWGDEISFSARLWTHGYDVYQPDRVVIYHYWRRDELAPMQVYRRDDTPEAKRVIKRLKHLLGFAKTDNSMALADIERYGLGNERPLNELWEFAGVDWKQRKISADAQQGRWNMNAKKATGKKAAAKSAQEISAPAKAQPVLPASNLPRIFVNIASYRDPDCQYTVKDLFEKAAHPERIFVGICWQTVRSEDAICFEIPYPRPDQVRVTEVDAKTSQGVCWARSQTQKLWLGEEFTLQIDSHMRFEPGWDNLLLDMWQDCGSPKAVLTCYPPGFTPPATFERTWIFGMAAKHFDAHGIFLMQGKPAFDEQHRPAHPVPGAFVSANMLFGPSSIITDVPYDPYLYFFGEEISLAVRLWTSGYNIFHPNKLVIFHDWNRDKRPTHFSDHRDWGVYNDLSFARVRHMLGTELSADVQVTKELNKYGLGAVRSLADYQRYSGVDFAQKTIAEHAANGIFASLVPAVTRAPAAQMTPAGAADTASRIFVQIASYRDRECQWTVKDLFEKAVHPERIFVGICWQFDPEEDKDCFQVVTRPEQVRILPVDWREAEGVCWARHQTQQLWEGEEYTLQIDAHMRFFEGWDELMIAELAACDAKKPLITCNPASYIPPDQLEVNPRPTVRRVTQFTPDGNIRGKGEALDRVPEVPLNGAFVSGGFMFSRADVIRKVPYDPYLYFDQEEVSYAARLYTHGWDVFSSRRPLLYHYYNIGKESVRPLHWRDLHQEDDRKMATLRDRGIKRFNHLTGFQLSSDPDVLVDMEQYGFGKERTLEQYEEYCGIDFKHKVASEKALRALFIRNLSRYRDHPIGAPEDAGKRAGAQPRRPALERPLDAGDFVPMFEAQDTNHKTRGIEVYAGKHCLLYFLPARDADYTGRFFQQLQQQVGRDNPIDAWQIFILDDTVEALTELAKKIGTPNVLWADPNHTLAKAFGLCRNSGDVVPPTGYILTPNLRILRRYMHLKPAQMAEITVEDARKAMAAFKGASQPQRIISEIPPALIVPDAFTPELCARCIESFHTGHTFEGTVGAEDKRAYRPNTKVRTDHVINGPLLDEIDDKLSRTLFPEIKKIFGFDVTFREFYKVGLYTGEKGGFFRQHRDNFDEALGYRRIAMTLHLNEDYEGGGLHFPEYDDHVYRPSAGSAIAFSCATMHEARPVTKGERFVLVGFFHGNEEEAYRRHYLMQKGLPAKVKDFLPAVHQYPPMDLSRRFYNDWHRQHVNPLAESAPQGQAVQPAISRPNIMVNVLGNQQAKKVFESKQALVFDDFLPESVYQKVYDYALETDYEYINTKGKISRAWHVNDGFPLRSNMNLFYYADESKKPQGDYVYPTKTPLDAFTDHLLGIQSQVQHMIGVPKTGWEHVSVTAWIYPQGTALSLHDDGSGIYSGAYIYYLNPTWRLHWGGLLMVMGEEGNRIVHDHRNKNDQQAFYKRKWLNANNVDDLLMQDGFAQCIFPKRNRIVFISNEAYHMVTKVNQEAGDNVRMSLAGFFNRGKKPNDY